MSTLPTSRSVIERGVPSNTRLSSHPRTSGSPYLHGVVKLTSEDLEWTFFLFED